jgi:hypothetical protein
VSSATEIVPIRATAVLAAITIRTFALPAPELGMEAIQSASVCAVHWQLGVAVSATESSVPAAGASSAAGETAYWQGAAA